MKVFDSALIFKAIVEHGSMIKAAEALSLNPSVISKKLMHLESELGVQLLKRTTRHIELTETGEVFYERIRNISQHWDASIEEVTSLNTHPKGTIRISSPQPLSSRLIVPTLKAFQQQYPGITLELMNTSYEQLPNLSADITICRKLDELNASSFVGVPLFKYQNSLFASPGYLDRHAEIKHISDVQKHRCLVYGVGKPNYSWTFSNYNEITIEPYICSDNTEIIISSASSGLGLAYIPEAIISSELSSGALINVLPDHKSKPFETYLYYQKMSYTPQKIRLLIDYLKGCF
ncbi:LysR family transcriptional regulator [Pseudoteredinibacter isoporae]|uniref:LysR family transcriptional regulator n=1 Tax=Pseudoteredinibacter isoporae TaxID=570281 RepID=UPI00310733FE